ncbi:MAG: DUF5691 domain-containing protein [Cytophagaceae bacterium]|jgi:hypothetical protein|nr:DUF5691 domain-containing protein [Cytophagaceae bacterium]
MQTGNPTEEEILKTVQLGTSRYLPSIDQYPGGLRALLQQLPADDREDFFIKCCASYFAYAEAGITFSISNEEPFMAPQESKSYASASFSSLLSLLGNQQEEKPLLYFLIQTLHASGQLAPPQQVPALLSMAIMEREPWRQRFLEVCGERGKWLASLNAEWSMLIRSESVSEEDWKTGTKEQRLRFIKQLREEKPDEALQLLLTAFNTEPAAMRSELLDVLSDTLRESDIPFLEQQLQDKSVKVRDTAYALLRMIPTSTLVKRYAENLSQGLEFSETRDLTLQKQKRIRIKSFELQDEEVFRSGLQKISSEKGKADHVYWMEQLCCWVPPEWWEQHSSWSLEEVVQSLRKEKETVGLAHAMVTAAVLFESKHAAVVLSKAFPGKFPDLFDLLTLHECFIQWRHADESNKRSVLVYLLQRDADIQLWPAELMQEVLAWLEKSPYSISIAEYGMLALRMPDHFYAYLQSKVQDTDMRRYERAYFATRATQMMSVMERKKQIQTISNL